MIRITPKHILKDKLSLQLSLLQSKKQKLLECIDFEFMLKFYNLQSTLQCYPLNLSYNFYKKKLDREVMGNQETKQEQRTFTFFKSKEKNQYKQLKGEAYKMCKCSWRTRIIGYVVCFAIGWILSIIATMIFFIKHNIVLFAILFSIGQVLNITGSCFLATPKTQIKDMFVKARIWFTIAYLVSTIVTIVLAVTLPEHLRFLVLISLIVEIGAYFFYTLSYIPYGRKILGKVCKIMVD